MLLITCHVCGAQGDETDFHYGGQAHVRRPATANPEDISEAAQRDYMYTRLNPKGLHFERWRCDRGCGKWFHAARDTVTMAFAATYGVTERPPAHIIAMIPETNPWHGVFTEAPVSEPHPEEAHRAVSKDGEPS
ncbi:sarcosine oxidase subunit delta [Rhodoligotrophos appendicifer]|uniref:sarcosine oxidase subunit delta n=1 Tax=Rhodoligotrophos appendicifer TaxID=987056 RepID=UPI001186C50A|nr:sarcosine oxidase subunit delta [Rhodoligotrophos appendicifer]